MKGNATEAACRSNTNRSDIFTTVFIADVCTVFLDTSDIIAGIIATEYSTEVAMTELK
jgi:hypothetical protein